MALFRLFSQPFRCRPALWGVALAAALSACAQSGVVAQAPPGASGEQDDERGVRVICRLTEPRAADNQLALELARAAGMPVARLSAIQDQLVAVTFRCHPSTRCEQGLARLRSVSPLVADVSPDGQARVPRSPVRPQERS
jgi:hypothetical protein